MWSRKIHWKIGDKWINLFSNRCDTIHLYARKSDTERVADSGNLKMFLKIRIKNLR